MKKTPIPKKMLSIIALSFFSVHWSLKGYLMDETCGGYLMDETCGSYLMDETCGSYLMDETCGRLRDSMHTQYRWKH